MSDEPNTLIRSGEDHSLVVQVGDDSTVSGRLISLTTHWVEAEFEDTPASTFTLGEQLSLRLENSPQHRSVVVRGRVQGRHDQDGRRVFTFEFVGTPGVIEWSVQLRTLISRRRKSRIAPDQAEALTLEVQPVAVVHSKDPNGPSQVCRLPIQPDKLELPACLVDLSEGGMGLVVPPEVEESLHQAEYLDVRLHLPGHERPIQVTACIRHRSIAGPAVRYGMEFVPQFSEDFEASRKVLASYVDRRQCVEDAELVVTLEA